MQKLFTMPIDYKEYPKNWLKEIRPLVLNRANYCCENCGVKNYLQIIRGIYNGVESYQNLDGYIYNASNSEYIGGDYLGIINPNPKIIKIILTIAHLDHNIENNELSNLKALCQKCHLNYDKDLHTKNRKESLKKKKGIIELNFNLTN